MKKILKLNLLFVFLAMFAVKLQAQKFGHVNSGNIIAQMPGTMEADSLLRIYQDSLVQEGEASAVALQTEFEAFYTDYQEGKVTPAVAQQKQAEFQQREQELIAFEDRVINMVGAKRQQLLSPILESLQAAINELGKEDGYTMIFDTSIFNAILFVEESSDVEALVKAKLNMQ